MHQSELEHNLADYLQIEDLDRFVEKFDTYNGRKHDA